MSKVSTLLHSMALQATYTAIIVPFCLEPRLVHSKYIDVAAPSISLIELKIILKMT